MTWPDNHPDDFDIFVQDPVGNVVWYRRRDIGFMALERDNRGGANNFVNVGGEKVLSPAAPGAGQHPGHHRRRVHRQRLSLLGSHTACRSPSP